jgi:two-component system, OmpR family, alkaline phosphatase synthesis response regulator PhoP
VIRGKRILLIEDEPTLSMLLEERLEKDGYDVSACHDGEQGLMNALRAPFDLVLLDVKLPKKSGFDVCRELRRHSVSLPILMLTARSDVKDRVKGLKMGADDYLGKPFDVTELLARIEALLRRANHLPPQFTDSVFCFGDLIIDLDKQEVLREGTPLEFTAKEFALLQYFVANPDQRLSRQKLLEEVWGYKGVLNTRTVDLHIAQLRQKVELDAKHPRHILTVFGSGYRFVPFP